MSFHKLDHAKDDRFWSVRVSSDLRLIVHRTPDSLLLCYADHHDKAYQWAERRKLSTHPKTGAAQWVEIRETMQEIVVPRFVEAEISAASKPPLFAYLPDEELLSYGVPPEWMSDVHRVSEDGLLELVDHLPSEAAEALLELATGGKPQLARTAPLAVGPFEHPDAQRRFRLMQNVEELTQALEFPWEKWTIFLHPAQRELVTCDYSGPARVSGSAGTGKTIVALHRAVHLVRSHPEARVLLTTFSETLANALRTKVRRLMSSEPRLGERLEVHALDALGQRLYEGQFGKANLASRPAVEQLLAEAVKQVGGTKFSPSFLLNEWTEVVDAWQLQDWEAYKDVRRLGRKTRLPEAQRAGLWAIFEWVQSWMRAKGQITQAGMFAALTMHLGSRKHPPFDFIVVDESQDVGVAQLRFLAALGSHRPDSLFFAGDLGQRIFQQPFSWKALGVDIRGRSKTLRINYRTSHQIRMQADRLLGPEVSDVDGNTENRRGTVSVFNGPAPTIRISASEPEEMVVVGTWLAERAAEGVAPHEMGIFVRSEAQLERALDAVKKAGLPFKVLDERVETTHGHASISTMHLAKGLEFRAVAVMACDDEVIPLQARIESATDDSDLEEVYNTERHLLYVACTRARDYLLVTSGGAASEFLDDLKPN